MTRIWLRWASASAVVVGTLYCGALLTGCGGKVDSASAKSSAHGTVPSNEPVGGTAGTASCAGASGSAGAPAAAASALDSTGSAGTGGMLTCEPTAAMLAAHSASYPGPCRVEQDEGFDGIIDSIWENTYDELGRKVASESLSVETGTTYVDTATYDQQGQLTARESGPEDAPPTWTDVYTYDDAGRLVQTITGPVAAGQLPLTTDYIYDDAGVLVRLEESRQPDGSIEARMLVDYDEAGRRFRDTYQNLVAGQWVSTRIVEREYDAAGRDVETRKDLRGPDGSPPDGVADWSNHNWYDQYGNILVSSEDQGADGTTDTCTVRYYGCW